MGTQKGKATSGHPCAGAGAGARAGLGAIALGLALAVAGCGGRATTTPAILDETGGTGPSATTVAGSGMLPVGGSSSSVDTTTGAAPTGAGGSATMPYDCEPSPFEVCRDYQSQGPLISASCDPGPVLVPVRSPALNAHEMEFEYDVYCAEDYDAEASVVLGYLPDQQVWAKFNGGGAIQFNGGVATVALQVTSIGETSLANVDPCAGWMVAIDSYAGGQFLLTANVREQAKSPAYGARKADDLPVAALCDPVPFGQQR